MNSKLLRYVIITIVLILSYGFITYKIIHFEELKSFDFRQFLTTPLSFFFLFVILMLMVVNWAIETYKWQMLIHKIQHFSFTNSFKAVLVGITVGVFTPNRVGEIGGRIAFLDKGKRTSGAFASAIGSLAQFIATIIMGVGGFILFLLFFPDKTQINTYFNKFSAIALFLVLALLVWSYYNVRKIIPLLIKIPFLKKKSEQIQYLSNETGKFLSLVLFLSTIRYLVFFLQFFLLLNLFNADINLLEGFVSISITYLFMTIIPTTTLIELGLRGSLAIFFIGMFSENTLGIVLASFFIWIINIAIPAVVGTFYLIKPKSLNLS